MIGFIGNIEELTLANDNFRQALATFENSQLVVMSLEPGEDIGMEVHEVDQFIRIEQGHGLVILNNEETNIKDDFAIVIPAGTQHNIINASDEEKMKLYTVYSPPEHPSGTVHKTKSDAQKAEESEE